MTKDAIGVVYTKEYLDSEEISENILKKKSSPIGMPDVIEPEGLSLARKQYLFDDIIWLLECFKIPMKKELIQSKKMSINQMIIHVQ